MKKYLLFAYGNFTNDVICENLIEAVGQITHSDFLKFKYDEGYIYFHFETQLQHDELVKYIEANLINVADCHILTEHTDKTSVTMNKIDKEQFLTLNMTQAEKDSIKKMSDAFPDFNQIRADVILEELLRMCDEEEDVEDEFYKVTKLEPKQKHNLDEILEKILKNGRASLTKDEIMFLKTV